MDFEPLIHERMHHIDASGIRRVFDLGASLKDPINLSIGQPDFDVPQSIKDAAAQAMVDGINGYTQTQGIAQLRQSITHRLQQEFPSRYGTDPTQLPDDQNLLVTSGVSGGLLLALMTCVGPGDDVLIPDPYFVMYKHLVTLAGANAVYIDTYPDFQITAERIEAAITPNTKLLLFNTPSNPTGVVATPEVCQQVAKLCDERNILLLSDEIYDEFCYEKLPSPDPLSTSNATYCPSPVHYSSNVLLLRGYSKTYAMTGWRLGYAVGPKPIVEQMTKLQQYSFVCAPSMVQVAGTLALDLDMSEFVAHYARKRDLVVEKLSPHYDLTPPGGAFYAFPKIPDHLNMNDHAFIEAAVKHNLLIIPGSVFSNKQTHFRLSYACDDAKLKKGLEVLKNLIK